MQFTPLDCLASKSRTSADTSAASISGQSDGHGLGMPRVTQDPYERYSGTKLLNFQHAHSVSLPDR